jgi:uncharacterized protein
MTALLDTTMVIGWYDAGSPHHGAAAAFARAYDEDLVTTPLAVADLDRQVAAEGGEAARRRLWRDLGAGVWSVRWWADGMRDTLAVARRHPEAGLTAASLVALAHVARTTRIATFDDLFRSLQTPDGQPLTLLPDRNESDQP